jgi:hypothetical protein
MKKFFQIILLTIPIVAWFFLVMTGLFLQSLASAIMIAADTIENKINKL